VSAPRLVLVGARGRMGRAVLAAALDRGVPVAAAVGRGDDLAAACAQGDVVVDFSLPEATRAVIAAATAAGRPLVIGTTGHAAAERSELAALAARVPTVWAGNFSVGVNLLFALAGRAARALGPEYDIELVEMHHRHKQDAPSGTAARLLEILRAERRLAAEAVRHGRQGAVGARPADEIGVHALRGGDVVGDHTVVFAGIGERVELTHKASDRAVFARGALRAAAWVVRQPPGLYDMQDMLGLKD
jgi:4-hydroxy-tetrahydrodipicolinate reductase